MATLDKSSIQLLTQFDVTTLTDEQYQLLVDIAIGRVNALLCDELDPTNIESALLPLVAELFVFTATNNPQDYGVKSETTENYSYSRDVDTANFMIRLRDKYADIIDAYSQCELKDGTFELASHNALWTPDYYREKWS